jgi:hypothetical protein
VVGLLRDHAADLPAGLAVCIAVQAVAAGIVLCGACGGTIQPVGDAARRLDD